uniref:Uncharacterized protein n=1 Tax=Aegilops tauschii subsp. strangulata TaxID=200361 RepID=A0A453D8X1_AEGTS
SAEIFVDSIAGSYLRSTESVLRGVLLCLCLRSRACFYRRPRVTGAGRGARTGIIAARAMPLVCGGNGMQCGWLAEPTQPAGCRTGHVEAQRRWGVGDRQCSWPAWRVAEAAKRGAAGV